jgi:hypothetical protein
LKKNPLSRSVFERYLKRGLGRAIQLLHQVDPRPYRTIVVDACMFSTRYDTLVEDDRSSYLWEAVRLCGMEAELHKRLRKRLPTIHSYNTSLEQRFGLLSILARQGHADAITTLHEHFDICLSLGRLNGVEAILQLEVDQGEYFLAERLGKFIQTGKPLKGYHSPFVRLAGWSWRRELWDDHEHAVWERLQAAAANSSAIAHYMQAVEAELERDSKAVYPERVDPRTIPYEIIKSQIADPSTNIDSTVSYWIWGRDASEDDLRAAAYDLLALPEDAHRQAVAYLNVFHDRPFPLDPTRIIDWARQGEHDDPFLPDGSYDYELIKPIRAFDALRHTTHPAIRQFALECFERRELLGWAVNLLPSNYQEGDWERVHPLIEHPMPLDDLHHLGIAVRNLFEAFPTAEAVPTLLRLVELDPCSGCRHELLENLQSIDALPESLRQESRYDANPWIRKYVASLGEPYQPGFPDLSLPYEREPGYEYQSSKEDD